MINILIQTIPHEKQRYETAGDYYYDKGNLRIQISEMENKYFEVVLAIHEIVEWIITEKMGIPEEEISKFDIDFIKEHPDKDPGDDLKAPYHKAHEFASSIENQLLWALGLSKYEYEKTIP